MNRDRSLEDLEGDRSPDPPADTTRLVATAHALRRQPIGELTVEDMRLLIRQDIGLRHLLPLAVEVLREDPMAEGDMYPGVLLSAVITCDPAAWEDFPDLRDELRLIAAGLADVPPVIQQVVERFLAAEH
ncbi:contact-dependent growth inhibition system immunity protein [Phytomonospora sp. NPDC050363]|uniref:contact-dependent growth inhibition system immunity protein n=1 Tax=Phytomonospora sp. NPDC050363 TaxID=3155642 RepID=UPI00340191CD